MIFDTSALPNMNMKSAKAGGSFTDIPVGGHLINIVQIIDLGMQYSKKYENTSHNLRFSFEVTDVQVEFERDGKMLVGPALSHKEISFTRGKKSVLPKLFAAADPTGELTGADIWKLIGLPAIANFVADPTPEKPTRTKIDSFMPLMQGVSPIPVTVEMYGFSPQAPNPEIWAKFSDYIKEKIRDNQSGGAEVYAQLEVATAGVTPQYTPAQAFQAAPSQPAPAPAPAQAPVHYPSQPAPAPAPAQAPVHYPSQPAPAPAQAPVNIAPEPQAGFQPTQGLADIAAGSTPSVAPTQGMDFTQSFPGFNGAGRKDV